MKGRETIIAWDRFLRRIRGFLHERGYYEVHTDHLVPAGAFEASIDAIRASGKFGNLELHTSPEMEMKALISQAHLSVFQICRAFRDDPSTSVHRFEFTMLEYYRVFGAYEGLQHEVSELFSSLAPEPVEVKRKTVKELFLDHVGVNIDDTQNAEALCAALREISPNRLQFHVSTSDSWQDLFFKAWVTLVEPALVTDEPILVCDYPIQIAALAAPSPADARYSQRFEIYWRGMEICNGAAELQSESLLLQRHEMESLLRIKDGKLPHPRPQVLVDALRRPLPECCGVAIGLERLFAAIQGRSSIN